MKRIFILLVMLFCMSTAQSDDTDSVVIHISDHIGDHIKNLEMYTKIEDPAGKPLGEFPTEVVMWKVGERPRSK